MSTRCVNSPRTPATNPFADLACVCSLNIGPGCLGANQDVIPPWTFLAIFGAVVPFGFLVQYFLTGNEAKTHREATRARMRGPREGPVAGVPVAAPIEDAKMPKV